jgi:hypothetical protein
MAASVSAVGDSGATRTLLREEAAVPYQKMEFNPRDAMEVIYGDGARATVSSKVQLGEVEALVVPKIQENLVSLSDLTSRGSHVVLTDEGGLITNSLNDKRIVLTKEEGTWHLPLSAIVSYDHKATKHKDNIFLATTMKTKGERYISLHERLCHQSPEVLYKMLKGDDPLCIRAGITAKEVHEIGNKYVCVPCVLSKRKAKSVAFNLPDPAGFDGGVNSKTAVPGQIISIDPVGPISPKSVNGFTLIWFIYDIASSYQWIFFSSSKQSSIIVEILRLVISDLRFHGKELKIVRSDAEEIFNAKEVQLFLEERGLKHQYSVPYAHYQNRVE